MEANHQLVLLLGSNLGNRIKQLDHAEKAIESSVGGIILRSSTYETSPWGNPDQPDFLNRVIAVITRLTADEILYKLNNIELSLGKSVVEKWGPRSIDIDILFYDDLIVNSNALKIPHSFLHERKFTLVPLNEILPDYIHPILNKTINQLIEECADQCIVKVYNHFDNVLFEI